MNLENLLTESDLKTGDTKKVLKENVRTEINPETGEIKKVISYQNFTVDKEPDYVKIYTNCQLALNNANVALSPYLIAFAKHMTYANNQSSMHRCTIQTNEFIREDVAKTLNVTDRQVQHVIKQLVEAEIFIPIYKNGMKKRGVYFVNPWVIAKGEWKDIKELRQEFEFVSNSTSICKIDENGNRKVIIPYTDNN